MAEGGEEGVATSRLGCEAGGENAGRVDSSSLSARPASGICAETANGGSVNSKPIVNRQRKPAVETYGEMGFDRPGKTCRRTAANAS